MTDAVHYSSEKSDWQTPPDLFNFLDKIFEFDFDACASDNNALCDIYRTENDSFLESNVTHRSIFMNPIYGKPVLPCKPNCSRKRCKTHGHITEYIPGTGDFVDHAYNLSKANNRIVSLLPGRLGSEWFEKVWKADAVVFMKGRIKFVGAKSGAPFPSILAVFGYGLSRDEQDKLSQLGRVFIL